MELADEESLARVRNIPSPPLEGLSDDENIWEKLLQVRDRNQRKEAKHEYLQPVTINSKYAFNIKNRDFKIKKYINHKAQTSTTKRGAADDDKKQNDIDDEQVVQTAGA